MVTFVAFSTRTLVRLLPSLLQLMSAGWLEGTLLLTICTCLFLRVNTNGPVSARPLSTTRRGG